MKNDKNDIYKMAKLRERKTEDFIQVKCIKNDADRLLVNDDEIKNRRREYFESCSMKRVRKSRLSWTIHLMTPTDNLFGEFKSLR
jgi:hypothetical protein